MQKRVHELFLRIRDNSPFYSDHHIGKIGYLRNVLEIIDRSIIDSNFIMDTVHRGKLLGLGKFPRMAGGSLHVRTLPSVGDLRGGCPLVL